jgi:iron(III) transport system substrate-binding protein
MKRAKRGQIRTPRPNKKSCRRPLVGKPDGRNDIRSETESRKMNNRKKKFGLAAIALAPIIAFTGCAPEAPAESTAESITIYSGRNENLISDLLDTFTQETGIQVNVRYGDSAELAAQILEEGANTQADVFFSQDAGALGALAKEGLTKTLPGDITDLVDASYKSDDSQWVGVSGRARVLVVNPEKVTEVPTSYKDLIDPSWKGRIAIAPTNASFQAFITAIRITEGDQAAEEFLVAMKENAVLFEKNALILQAVEDGVVDAGLINHYYWFELEDQKGVGNMTSELVWFKDQDPGNLINVAGVAVLTENASANVFVKWLLGDTAQNYFVERTREYSLTGVPDIAGVKPFGDIKAPNIDLSDLDSLAETLELIRKAGLL